MTPEREEEICQLYRDGRSMREVGRLLKVSRENVRQILRNHKVSTRWKGSRMHRDEFIGANITKEDKKAFRREAARRGMSMSALTSDLIKKLLAEVRSRQPAPLETMAESKETL